MTTQTTPRLGLLLAFAAVYLIWGSTYLAIVFAIETMPPLLMLGARFVVAGGLVLAWTSVRGGYPLPDAREWRNAAIVGTLTLSAGTGAVAWAEQWVPSGIAALLVTTVPVWMVLLEWKWKKGGAPNVAVWTGLGLGAFGIYLLLDPGSTNLAPGMGLGILAILVATVAFSVGAILGRDLRLPERPLMSTAAQMIAGGGSLTLAGLLRGELAQLNVAAITAESWLAWAYLMVFGSIVAYGSFVWLMKNVSPARVSTYAYVNPVVAVFLGWLWADEVVDGRVLLAVVLLLSAVLLISRFGRRSGRPGTSRLANRSGAILSAFAHSMDRPATSLPRDGALLFRRARLR